MSGCLLLRTCGTQQAAMLKAALVTSREACFPPFQLHSISSGHKCTLMLKAHLFPMTVYYIKTVKLLPNIAHCDRKNLRLLEDGDSIFWHADDHVLNFLFSDLLTWLNGAASEFFLVLYAWMKSKMMGGCLHSQIVAKMVPVESWGLTLRDKRGVHGLTVMCITL